MKILHLIDSLGYGGAETLMMNYIPQMQDHDHVISTLSGINLFPQVAGRFKYYNLDGSPTKDLFPIIYKLKKIISKEQIDIVHSHSYWTNIISRLVTPKNKKLINHYHFADFDTRLHNYKVKMQLKIDQTITHCNLQRIAVSEYVYSILKKHFHKSKNNCLPNFVNSEISKDLKLFNYSKSTPLKIIAVGNIKQEKGYDILISAFEKLKDYPIEMDVFGEGGDFQMYVDELNKRGITALRFCGRQKSTPELLHQYNLYCSSSTSETFGIALMEAVSAGLPALVSDIPAFREVAPKSTRFFKMGDSDDFVSQVIDIYKNGINTIEHEYKYVLDKYSKSSFLEHLREIYQYE